MGRYADLIMANGLFLVLCALIASSIWLVALGGR